MKGNIINGSLPNIVGIEKDLEKGISGFTIISLSISVSNDKVSTVAEYL